MRLYHRWMLVSFLAVGGAWILADGDPRESYQERLIGLVAAQELGDAIPRIGAEDAAFQAALLEYSGDPLLLLESRIALMKYPRPTRIVLPLVGHEPDFREALALYGAQIVPVVGYFVGHPVASLEWRRIAGFEERSLHAVGEGSGSESGKTVLGVRRGEGSSGATAAERALDAAHSVLEDGHDFLGQFEIDEAGDVEWIQSERLFETLSSFLGSGVRGLEIKWRLGEEVNASDGLAAALDVLAVGASLKLLRIGKGMSVAKASRSGSAAVVRGENAPLLAARLLSGGGRVARTAAKLGAIPAAVYLGIRHPSLVNGLITGLAGSLGVDPWRLQVAVWFLVLIFALRLALWSARPVGWILRAISWSAGVVAGFLEEIVQVGKGSRLRSSLAAPPK